MMMRRDRPTVSPAVLQHKGQLDDDGEVMGIMRSPEELACCPRLIVSS